jgi:hypothetical protein
VQDFCEELRSPLCEGRHREPRAGALCAAEDEGGALTFYVRDAGQFAARDPNGCGMRESGGGLEFMRRPMDEVEVQPGADGTLVRFSMRP